MNGLQKRKLKGLLYSLPAFSINERQEPPWDGLHQSLAQILAKSPPIDPLHWLSFSPNEFAKEARKRFLILGLSHDVVHPRVNNCVAVPPPSLSCQ